MELFFILALVATSIVAVTFIIERGLALRSEKVIPPAVQTALAGYRPGDDPAQLRQVLNRHPSALGRLASFALEHLDWSREENVQLLETRARHEVARLERGLIALEIIVGIAPLLGLVGTIYGLILLFAGMGDLAAGVAGGDSTMFARGISTALRATLIGLLVAIPALIAWSYYSKKIENLTIEMETLIDEFLRRHYRQPPSEAETTVLVARAK